MTSNWAKFKLLLWKNSVIQKRHYVQTIFEILIPVLACSILILIRGLVDPEVFPSPVKYKPFETINIDHLRLPTIDPPIVFKIAYSPHNVILDKLIADATYILGPDIGHEPFQNALDLQSFLANNNYLAGIELDDILANITKLPENLSYAIRFPGEMRSMPPPVNEFTSNWRTDLMFPAFQIAGARNRDSKDGGYPANYNNEGFIAIQSAMSRAFILSTAPLYSIPDIYMNRYPYPAYYSDPLLTGLENLLPLIILIAFFYTGINTVKYITVEKEKQLKEAMKIMGLPSWLHWAAWFVKSIVLLFISISLITVLLCVNITTNSDLAIFEYADWTVVWFFLFVYSITSITFCFMMSVFFSKANTAAGIAGLAWFIFTMPFNISVASYGALNVGAKLGLCLFSNSAMSFGFLLMMRFEGTATGLQWSNLFSPVTVDDNFSIGLTVVMLLVDAVLYLAIALYFEKVMPGEFGIAEPWYFLFTKKFWTSKVGVNDQTETGYLGQPNSSNIETEPRDKNAGIQIKGLRKVFNQNKVAVSGLNLNMYEDQITVLLGHNGAGKTTTMSMLTGMFSPTSGTATINGSDIRANIEGVRSSLGLCPQHNILFDELTVAEHISFFCRLKGVKKADEEQEIKKYVVLLELEDKINSQSHTLSGGMKRKLSVGVALCGNSKVVLCDEPTSGMDPAARRALWDLLQKEKFGRTILLSTHFMDEADILGDRIAIMADGELKAAGSSFFLKKKFGVGYRLVCVKEENCNTENLTALLRKYIPNVVIDTDIGSELSYILNEDYTKIFEVMLRDLEENTEDCGITSYGISLTTLEEVFLKVGSDSTALDSKSETNGLGNYESRSMNSTSTLHFEDSGVLLQGTKLNMNQVNAMFLKKFISTKRAWIQLFVQNFIPLFFVAMTIVIVRTFPEIADMPPLKLSLDTYSRTTTVLETSGYYDNNIVTSYKEMFKNFPSWQILHLIEDVNIEDYILEISEKELGTVNNQYMAGASLTSTNITIWFNAQGYHTAPLTLNLMFNAILKSVCATCDMVVINKPMKYRPETQFNLLQAGNNMGFQLSFNTGFAMAFVSAIFIMFYIKERASRAKLLQFVSGVNVFTFWIVSFIWDFLSFTGTTILYVALLAIFQEDGWSTANELGRVFLFMITFGFAALPFTYLFSYLFDVPSTGFVKMMIFNIFSGTILFTTVFLLSFDGFDLVEIARGLEWAFMLFPHFSLSHSLSNINIAVTTQKICEKQCQTIPMCTDKMMCSLFPKCCDTDIFTFKSTGVARNLVYMFGVGLISFLIILAIEYRLIERIFQKRYFGPPPPETEDLFLDSDVKKEKERIQNMNPDKIKSTNLVISSMTKFYKKFLAVNQISVAVDHTECFGLLGVNGAGKTSTFKMLTGDVNISSGEAWVKGINLSTNMNNVHKVIGYCPQFDALLEDLTGRETLRIFALLRGIKNNKIEFVSMKLAEDLNFMKHIDKKIKEYSGGNKRKLSTALALIGNPSVVYLDEPTTGMDPGAKRQLWNMICKVRNSGKSIVLTSHSMEECEALCTRLAIMVNGEFKCIGSTQHLKNKFSKGFFLTIKLKKSEQAINNPTKTEAVKNYIAQYFTGAYLKEEYQDSLTYHITQSELKWSKMFGLMEEAKTQLEIEDYALGQTSLEQVFLFFTKYQRIT